MKQKVTQIRVYDDFIYRTTGEKVEVAEGVTHYIIVDGDEHEFDVSDDSWEKLMTMPLAEALDAAGSVRKKTGPKRGQVVRDMTGRKDVRQRQRRCLDAAGISYKNPGRGFRYTHQADRVFFGADAAGLLVAGPDGGMPHPGVTRADLLAFDREESDALIG